MGEADELSGDWGLGIRFVAGRDGAAQFGESVP